MLPMVMGSDIDLLPTHITRGDGHVAVLLGCGLKRVTVFKSAAGGQVAVIHASDRSRSPN